MFKCAGPYSLKLLIWTNEHIKEHMLFWREAEEFGRKREARF
jgi:hypothetical protein